LSLPGNEKLAPKRQFFVVDCEATNTG